jgi:hypothetical protein
MASEAKVECRRQRGVLGGVALIVVGGVALLVKQGIVDPQLLRQWWPLALIGVGTAMLVTRLNRRA